MREIDISKFNFTRTFGRNTAPAITTAALKSLEIDEDPVLLVLSSV